MTRRSRYALAAVASLISGVAAPTRADDAADAARTVDAFYATYIPSRGGGLPEGPELEALTPYLSVALRARIDAALAYRERFVATHPSRPTASGPPIVYKPPFVDGDYFSSLFEGARRHEVLATTRVAPATWHVWVRFEYAPDGDHAWTDTVVVTEAAGRFGLDDVIYSGGGPFNPPGQLTNRIAVDTERAAEGSR